MRRLHRKSGFTLIEIMVVVFILGLLVTLVAPRVMDRGEHARRTKAQADLKAIEQAVHLFKLDHGVYPTSADGLEALVRPPAKIKDFPADGYIPAVPIDPWGNPYAYFSDGPHFLVKSYGADGHEGGDGPGADLLSGGV